MPTISVVMSVYNCEDYLAQSIESVLNQSYVDFEFLITDDNSDDLSFRIIDEYSKKDDRIIVFQNHERIGLTKSINQMIKICKGNYIARMDADDIAFKDRFSIQYGAALNYPSADILFSDSILIDKSGNHICKSWRPRLALILKWMPYYNYIPHPTVFIKTEAIKKVGYYNEDFEKAQDWELWNRLIRLGYEFHYINQALIYYRVNPEGKRQKTTRSNNYNLARICIYNKDKLSALKYFKKIKFIEFILLANMLLLPSSFLIHRIVFKRKQNFEKLLGEIHKY